MNPSEKAPRSFAPPHRDGAPERGRARGRRTKILARTDMAAAVLAGLAIVLSALPLYGGPPPGGPVAFALIAPLCGAGLFVTLIIMFAESERHGLARGLLVGLAVAMAVSAIVFTRLGVPPQGVLLSYWLPAILSMTAAVLLVRGHQVARRVQVRHDVDRSRRAGHQP